MAYNNLGIALEYAAKGWQIFPALWGRRKGKSAKTHLPLCKWATESSTDEAVIRKWAEKGSDKGVYFCVNLKGSGLNVIDIDIKGEKKGDGSLFDLELEYGELPETLKVRTPSGGEHHYFNGGFRKQTTELLGAGIDTPTMVPLPGSFVDGKGVYEVVVEGEVEKLPEWVGGLLGEGRERVSGELSCGAEGSRERDRALVELDTPERLASAVEFLLGEEGTVQGSGADAAMYKVACRVRDIGLSKEVALDYMLRFYYYRVCSPSHKPSWVKDKIENAYAYGIGRIGEADAAADFDRVAVAVEGKKEIRVAVMDSLEYGRVQIPRREKFLDPWVVEESIGLCSGHRGLGKSWFGMFTAGAIASGGSFGPWSCPVEGGVPCLYLEGEMASRDIQDRLRVVGEHKNLYVYSDAYASTLGLGKANVGSAGWRLQMKQLMLDLGIKFWVMDNIYSLSTGFDVNSDKDWSPVNEWLLDLKFSGISTLMLHHVGKGGTQLGTSTREANIDISIMLTRTEDYDIEEGAKFTCSFTKTRSIEFEDMKKIRNQQFHLKQNSEGKFEWDISSKKQDKIVQIIKLKDTGMSNVEISEIIGTTKQNIGQTIKRAKEKKLLNSKGKLTSEGLNLVISDAELKKEDFES